MLTFVAVISGLEDDGIGVKNVSLTTYRITICENNSYCCGNGIVADICCELKQGFFLSTRQPRNTTRSHYRTLSHRRYFHRQLLLPFPRLSASPLSSSRLHKFLPELFSIFHRVRRHLHRLRPRRLLLKPE